MDIPNFETKQFYASKIGKSGLERPFIQQFLQLAFQFVIIIYKS